MADFITRTKDDLTYLTSPQLNAFLGLRHAFFTRRGGVSAGEYESLNFRFSSDDSRENVLKNYSIGAALLSAQQKDIARTMQTHTDRIVTVDRTDGPDIPLEEGGFDALITNRAGICLTGFYADCQLVMLYDHKQKACGIVHAGWRGVANQIVGKTIEEMTRRYDCRPADMTVAVGPSICRRCFETDEDVPEMLLASHGEQIRDYIYKEKEKWHVDLKNITYTALLRVGILPFNIDMSNACPCCETEGLFWSHRRHGEARGVHAGMIYMEQR